MKKLSVSLQLNKRSIQLLDDRALVDLRGGMAASDCSCDECSCNEVTCGFASCKQQ